MPRGGHNRLFSHAEEEAICDEYAGGHSQSRIAKSRGINQATVGNILRRHGRESRKHTRTHTLNEAAFDGVEHSPEGQYWAGLLMADGCVTGGTRRNGLSVALRLSGEDGALVHQFREFLGSSHAVHVGPGPRNFNTTYVTSFSVRSNRLAEALARVGVVPRKSLTAEARLIEDSRDFWRGVVDGDGCLGIHRATPAADGPIPYLGLCGSGRIVQQFSEFVSGRLERRGAKPRRRRGVNLWEVRFLGWTAVSVARLLYEGAPVALERKRRLAEGIMAWGNSHTPKPRGCILS